jgi:hypothetical protein
MKKNLGKYVTVTGLLAGFVVSVPAFAVMGEKVDPVMCKQIQAMHEKEWETKKAALDKAFDNIDKSAQVLSALERNASSQSPANPDSEVGANLASFLSQYAAHSKDARKKEQFKAVQDAFGYDAFYDDAMALMDTKYPIQLEIPKAKADEKKGIKHKEDRKDVHNALCHNDGNKDVNKHPCDAKLLITSGGKVKVKLARKVEIESEWSVLYTAVPKADGTGMEIGKAVSLPLPEGLEKRKFIERRFEKQSKFKDCKKYIDQEIPADPATNNRPTPPADDGAPAPAPADDGVVVRPAN